VVVPDMAQLVAQDGFDLFGGQLPEEVLVGQLLRCVPVTIPLPDLATESFNLVLRHVAELRVERAECENTWFGIANR